MRMDKYDLVFDIIEHPENYPDARLSEILADEETREIYNLLCKTRSAAAGVEMPAGEDVETEWRRFEERNRASRFRFLWLSGRAASVAVLLLSSLVAVAIVVVVKVTVFDRDDNAANTRLPEAKGVMTGGNAVAANDTVAEPQTMDDTDKAPLLFENASLSEIVEKITKAYGVQAEYRSDKAAGLRLYYRLDPSNTLDVVIDQLNTFEQINIRIEGKTIVVE